MTTSPRNAVFCLRATSPYPGLRGFVPSLRVASVSTPTIGAAFLCGGGVVLEDTRYPGWQMGLTRVRPKQVRILSAAFPSRCGIGDRPAVVSVKRGRSVLSLSGMGVDSY